MSEIQQQLPMKEVDKGVYIYTNVESRLGNGTFGSVFKGLYRPDSKDRGTEIALKTFNNRNYRDKEIEADLMKGLDHPNIVKVIKAAYSATYGFYIAMELCETTLKGLLNKQGIKKFKEKEACVFFRDICLGIKYLQERGILHRDLKLENIMIDKNQQIKIGDFGLAKLVEGDITMTTCGSTHIMAPEVFKRQPYGKESDIWSLGVLLFGMISGDECLFRNVSRQEYEERIKNYKQVIYPPGCEDLSAEVKDLLSKMLVADPKARLTIGQILEHPWIKSHVKDDDMFSSRYYIQQLSDLDDFSRSLVFLKTYFDRIVSKELFNFATEKLELLSKMLNLTNGLWDRILKQNLKLNIKIMLFAEIDLLLKTTVDPFSSNKIKKFIRWNVILGDKNFKALQQLQESLRSQIKGSATKTIDVPLEEAFKLFSRTIRTLARQHLEDNLDAIETPEQRSQITQLIVTGLEILRKSGQTIRLERIISRSEIVNLALKSKLSPEQCLKATEEFTAVHTLQEQAPQDMGQPLNSPEFEKIISFRVSMQSAHNEEYDSALRKLEVEISK